MTGIQVDFAWNGDAAAAALKQAAMAGLKAAAEYYRDRLQSIIHEFDDGPPSLPGEAPHGQPAAAKERDRVPLADSIQIEEDLDAGAYYVYSDAPHAKHLEMGTMRMAPRPLWSRTLADEEAAMRDICVNTSRKASKL